LRSCASENLEIPGLVLAHHPGMTNSYCRRNRALDLAEADAVAVALAPAAHDKRVAVFEKSSLDTAGQFQRLGSVPADLQQAAALVLFRTGDGAASQEIAAIHG